MVCVGMNGSFNKEQLFRFRFNLEHLDAHSGRYVMILGAMDKQDRKCAIPNSADWTDLVEAESGLAPNPCIHPRQKWHGRDFIKAGKLMSH